MTSSQADLFTPSPSVAPTPDGYRLIEDLISPDEEAGLMSRFERLPFEAFDFHGFKGKREVIYFGGRYDFSRGRLDDAPPLPDWIEPLRDRAAAFAGLKPDALAQLLINRYPPGAGIGWHRDRPQFGQVVGVSLGAPAVMRFRRARSDGKWDRLTAPLPPRSAYLLGGDAREVWQHSIVPGEALRYSATFRTLR